jgi:FKBP-type peptidyl-prolyl cis-trans isomerase
VLIHETTTAASDGRLLYSTRTKGRPLRFLLGGKQVIDGVDEGVTGMRVGERRKVIVPPHLSRRTVYPEALSPDETLHYDVELVGIER